MKFRTIGSKLAARLRSDKQPKDDGDTRPANYPDLGDMVSKVQPHDGPALMGLPREVRNLIMDILWNDAGIAQHIVFRRGRYTSSKCVTDHSAPDDLMKECAKHRTNPFEDAALWLRMTSAWGNHWKCEELHQDGKSMAAAGGAQSLFLAMMLVCKQM